MHVVMGGTGHVGSALADVLAARGEAVTILTRDAARARRRGGIAVAVADTRDPASLAAAFRTGRRAFLLNPPGDVAGDADADERASIAAILAALDGSGLEKVVAESTGGAQPGERIGDLGTLWTLERGLACQPIPAAINRAAYYMSNWDGQLDAVRETGRLVSMLPAGLEMPMVAPRDLGIAAADRMMSGLDDVGIRDVEGPRRYTPVDVARALADALGRPVALDVVPPERWEAGFREMGFSAASAASFARMTAAAMSQPFAPRETAIRGATTLEAYIGALVAGDTGG